MTPNRVTSSTLYPLDFGVWKVTETACARAAARQSAGPPPSSDESLPGPVRVTIRAAARLYVGRLLTDDRTPSLIATTRTSSLTRLPPTPPPSHGPPRPCPGGLEPARAHQYQSWAGVNRPGQSRLGLGWADSDHGNLRAEGSRSGTGGGRLPC